MKKENITSMTLQEANGLEPEKDPEEGSFDWSRAQINMPQPKQPISVRLDADVIDFFKSQGKGYQTRINAVLRSYMIAHSEESARIS